MGEGGAEPKLAVRPLAPTADPLRVEHGARLQNVEEKLERERKGRKKDTQLDKEGKGTVMGWRYVICGASSRKQNNQRSVREAYIRERGYHNETCDSDIIRRVCAERA